MPLLEVRNLSVGIRRNGVNLRAVNEISFNIEAGEITAIIGESGGGKTLTALSIPRLLPNAAHITGGEIIFDSTSLHTLGETEMLKYRGKEISMIFQEPRRALNPLMRVGNQIAETLELRGEKNRRRLRQAALEMLGAMGFDEPEKIYRTFPHQLSLGMCQRIMIAIAAMCKPRLLIADEPAASLDSETECRVLEILARLNRESGTAILFISHDIPLIRRFAARLFVMYGGRILEDGSAETILSNPAHPYTQGLLNAIPSREKRGNDLPRIGGRSPSIEDTVAGCPFAPRCPRAQSRCLENFPPQTDTDSGQRVYCFYPRADGGCPCIH